jgi:glycosyltransferase involved in cell wall biosynthesis
MAGGVPAVACRGEAGPEEIASAGGGIALVPPRSPRALADQIDLLLSDPAHLRHMGHLAQTTVKRAFTWEQCGRATVEAYRAALEQSRAT